jgi:hypothetical protein
VRWGLDETNEGGSKAHRGRGVAMVVASIPGGVAMAPTVGVDMRQEGVRGLSCARGGTQTWE